MKELHLAKIENALAELNGTLRKECIDTQLITIEQWNEKIAPKLSRLSNVIKGYMPDSPTARTYEITESYFD